MWSIVTLALAITCAYAQETLQLPAGAELIIGTIKTSFRCPMQYGYYADADNDCKVFHVCNPIPQVHRIKMEKYSFICGNLTVFDQLSQTCTLPENAIPCANSADFFYLNERIGREDALFLETEDIDKAGKLVPLYSRYSEEPTRNGRPAGKPLGFQGKAYYTNRDRSPASSIREDLNVTALNGQVNRNRLYVPHKGGLLNIQKNPASRKRPANNSTRRTSTPSFGTLPGYGNRLNLDVINFRDEKLRVRRPSLKEGQDNRERVRGKGRFARKFVTNVDRLPAASGQTIGKLDPSKSKNSHETVVEKTVKALVVKPEIPTKNVAEEEPTVATPIENDKATSEQRIGSSGDVSQNADIASDTTTAPVSSTQEPDAVETTETQPAKIQLNDEQESSDKASQSESADSVPKIQETTTTTKNEKATSSSKTKVVKVIKPKKESEIPAETSTKEPVTPETNPSTVATTSSPPATSNEPNDDTSQTPSEKSTISTPAVTEPSKEATTITTTTAATTTAAASTTPAPKTSTPNTPLSTTEKTTVSAPESSQTSPEQEKREDISKETAKSTIISETASTTRAPSISASHSTEAKDEAIKSSVPTETITTTPKSLKNTEEQTTLQTDLTTPRSIKTDSPMIVVTMPPLPATSSTITEEQRQPQES